jgi:hypothetical protein
MTRRLPAPWRAEKNPGRHCRARRERPSACLRLQPRHSNRRHASQGATDDDPQAWLADVLARIADHPAHRMDELLQWNWRPLRSRPVKQLDVGCNLTRVHTQIRRRKAWRGWLWDLQINMNPEDGCLWVHGVGEEGVPGFTAFGQQARHRQGQPADVSSCDSHRMLTLQLRA